MPVDIPEGLFQEAQMFGLHLQMFMPLPDVYVYSLMHLFKTVVETTMLVILGCLAIGIEYYCWEIRCIHDKVNSDPPHDLLALQFFL